MQHTTEIVLVVQAIVIIKKRFFMTVCKISLEWTCCNTGIITNHLNA